MIFPKRKELEKEMPDDVYINQLQDIFNRSVTTISNIKPSEWTEQNVVMQKPFPGPFRYSRTPYTREIIDCLSQDHPAKTISVMKGAQIGFSAGVIFPGCAWLIKNNPGNTFITVGAPDLIEKATEKLDIVITNAGLRNYIKPQVMRRRNNKSGDTNSKKEFSGGYINITSANNHKAIRDVSLQYGFFDDFESVKSASKESGSTIKLLEQRFAAYEDQRKVFIISTPERAENSNIETAYLLGDQRKYLIPCECCKKLIEIVWSVDVEGDPKNKAGIHWELDHRNKLIDSSVGYICQLCGEFFTDKNKYNFLNDGRWNPTAEPFELGYYSYHISSLYAPLGMFGWRHYIQNYLQANPIDQPRNEDLHKSHMNLCCGLTYEQPVESLKAYDLQLKNIRNYEVEVIPESLSIKDGNGKIVLLTCASDMNGKLEDARLDYEIVAWSESGAAYSISHGSIGTFIPNESGKKNKVVREHWTYEHRRQNSIWPEFDKILGKKYKKDTGADMTILVTGLDTGYCELQAFTYIDNSNYYILGLKGDKEHKAVKLGIEVPNFTKGKSRNKLYMLKVGQLKDDLFALMKLRWDAGNDDVQPPGFLNFPSPSNNKYTAKDYFSHYESEERKYDKEAETFIWQKINSIVQNHLWDCRIYNMAIKEIFTEQVCKEYKLKQFGWNDFCDIILGRR